jgi:hypothetical protein
MKFNFIQKSNFFSLISFLIIFSSCNKLGPQSDKLIGKWTLLDLYSTIKTIKTINLEKSGGGTLLIKKRKFYGLKIIYSYTIKYSINWHTRTNGDENFLIIKYKEGKITKDSSENEQDITKEIHNHIGKSDTTFFAVEKDGSLICHLPNDNKMFKIN